MRKIYVSLFFDKQHTVIAHDKFQLIHINVYKCNILIGHPIVSPNFDSLERTSCRSYICQIGCQLFSKQSTNICTWIKHKICRKQRQCPWVRGQIPYAVDFPYPATPCFFADHNDANFASWRWHTCVQKLTQKLKASDHRQRRVFGEWVLKQLVSDPNFHRNIIFSDDGYVKEQNCPIWDNHAIHMRCKSVR